MAEPGLTLLVCPDATADTVSILVPKRRGTGYLRSPLGHHHGPLSGIAYDIGYDIYGLDGSLDIQVTAPRYLCMVEMTQWLHPIVQPIADHYGMKWKIIGRAEFWDKHPFTK